MQKIDKSQAKALIQKILKGLFSKYGVRPYIGAELEFYLIGNGEDPKHVVEEIERLYCKVDKEKGWNQYECVLKYTKELMSLADNLDELKDFITVTARSNQLKAVFDPKPFADDYGSALHLQVSLHNDLGQNLFADFDIADNKYVNKCISGLMNVLEESVYLLFNEEEDFARLDSKYMAPTNVSWGGNNRTTAIRMPEAQPPHRRIEFRLAGSNTDPHIAIAVLLLGIWNGFENDLITPDRTYGNAFDDQYGLKMLPTSPTAARDLYFNRKKMFGLIENL